MFIFSSFGVIRSLLAVVTLFTTTQLEDTPKIMSAITDQGG